MPEKNRCSGRDVDDDDDKDHDFIPQYMFISINEEEKEAGVP